MSAALVGCAVAASLPWLVGRRASPQREGRAPVAADIELDVGFVLDLLDVAIGAGASVPRALAVVGEAVGGVRGTALGAVASALLLGASWHAAWAGAPAGLGDVERALGPSWTGGAAPGPALRARVEQLRRERRTRVRAAAGALGVRLVLPLGLCFLPAFLLLGLAPMLLGLAAGLLG